MLWMLARRAGVKVKYAGVDISKYIEKDLLSFRYTDNASGTADDIEITLKDEKGIWLKEWRPQKGDTIEAEIQTLNWKKDGDKSNLFCGSFILDEPEYAGRPRTITLRAISTPSNTNFTNTKRTQAWENIKLSTIGRDIANRAGLSFFFDSSVDPIFKRQEQTDTPDMTFLAELCEKEGLAFKVTDKKIVIFDEAKYEKRSSVAKFIEDSSTVLSYNLKTTMANTAYAGCQVTYYDPKLKQTVKYLFTIKEDIDEKKDKIYKINSKVGTGEEAKRLAQKTLRKLNKMEYQARLTVVGNIALVGGNCTDLVGFGAFDGKYYIDKAVHNLPGYTTEIELHRVLEGY